MQSIPPASPRQQQQQQRRHCRGVTATTAGGRPAFTLTELMISIALVLMLVLAINKVFRITSDTIGASQTLSTAVRDQRAIQAVFSQDFQSAVPADAPCITLDSSHLFAFRNAADAEGDRDGRMDTFDLNGDNDENDAPDETVLNTTYNFRNHRTDIVNFFAGGFFRRQTGDDGTYASATTASEAWIQYGHLRVYDGQGDPTVLSGGTSDDGSYPPPGAAAAGNPNPNNLHASQWILGRVQILLSESLVAPPASEHHIRRRVLPESPPAGPDSLAPLSVSSNATQSPFLIQHHRFDFANTSIAGYRDLLSTYLRHVGPPNNPTNTSPEIPAFHPDWWTRMNYRFICNPFVVRPHDSAKMALTAPIFVTGCTQFMVEYAGDFLDQKPDGTLNTVPAADRPSVGDGHIDFIAHPIPGTSNPERYYRTVRWYGLPRDTGSSAANTVFRGRPDGVIQFAYDVVPLATVRAAGGATPNRALFEKQLPAGTTNRYVCAWDPSNLARGSYDRPLMFRITLTVDDPVGKLSDGQVYEYVMKMGL